MYLYVAQGVASVENRLSLIHMKSCHGMEPPLCQRETVSPGVPDVLPNESASRRVPELYPASGTTRHQRAHCGRRLSELQEHQLGKRGDGEMRKIRKKNVRYAEKRNGAVKKKWMRGKNGSEMGKGMREW